MRYGLELPNAGICGDARVLAELARLAERSGWDGVFLEDYITHWTGAPTCDPWVALAAMALRTDRIRLGTEVTPLARRRPWKIARELVTLDHLSGGRMILGVGTGDPNDSSLKQVGEVSDAKERAATLDEALDVLVGLWRGALFSYSGAHYQVRDATFLPVPVQRPRIPIWIGGGWPHAGPTRRAARWDGSCLYKVPASGDWADFTPADVRQLRVDIARYRVADDPNTTPFEIVLGGRRRGPDWEQERALIASLAEAGATWWVEYIPVDFGSLDEIRTRIAAGPLASAA
jgi:alkanesulfonate monooxygenase SsuD/methylene tetrahydromethanopterin reductase-like flavin-dependent oxidoreductase (luciferase family)